MLSKRRVGGGFKYEKQKQNKSDNNLPAKPHHGPIILESLDSPQGSTTSDQSRKSLDRYPVLGAPPSHGEDDDVFVGESEKQDRERTEKEDLGKPERKKTADGHKEPKSTNNKHREAKREGKEGNQSLPLHLHVTVNYNAVPLLRHVQDNVIGHLMPIKTPFGTRKGVLPSLKISFAIMCYLVTPIHIQRPDSMHDKLENIVQRADIIKKCVNAGRDDVVIFTGSGVTAAIHKIAWGLKIACPRVASETVLFMGPYEHHSNILPWREYGVQVVRIRQDKKGLVDMDHLKTELKFWKDKRHHLIVSMSAASNVTGIITDTEEVARIAHLYGALAIFDFAAGGPYLDIDMNPSKSSYKDAVMISPHKFVGGPGTPGVLIAKKWLFKNSVPHTVGGGTVSFVTRERHWYVSNVEEREEGGTPAIIESVRAGLVFKLKKEIGVDIIHAREQDLLRRAFEVWEKNPCILVLGSHTAERVAIISFLTFHQESGRLVHHNFISALLSDLFGIQARGGCACAGPYVQDLMGMSHAAAKKYAWFLSDKPRGQDISHPENVTEIMKPGFTRINLPYFYDDETIEYIIQAVDLVNRYGWKMLPKYEFNSCDSSWKHVSFANSTNGNDLGSLDLFSSSFTEKDTKMRSQNSSTLPLEKTLEEGKRLLETADSEIEPEASEVSKYLKRCIPKDKRRLRFFLTPLEASRILSGVDSENSDKKRYCLPFKLREFDFIGENCCADDICGMDTSAQSTQKSRPSVDEKRHKKDNETDYNMAGKEEDIITE